MHSQTSQISPMSQIDMFTPAETCDRLNLAEAQLLDLVNDGQLAAYNLGGNVRFKQLDVLAVQQDLVAA